MLSFVSSAVLGEQGRAESSFGETAWFQAEAPHPAQPARGVWASRGRQPGIGRVKAPFPAASWLNWSTAFFSFPVSIHSLYSTLFPTNLTLAPSHYLYGIQNFSNQLL